VWQVLRLVRLVGQTETFFCECLTERDNAKTHHVTGSSNKELIGLCLAFKDQICCIGLPLSQTLPLFLCFRLDAEGPFIFRKLDRSVKIMQELTSTSRILSSLVSAPIIRRSKLGSQSLPVNEPFH